MRLLPPRRSVLSGRIEIGGRDVLAMSERDLADLRGTEVGMIFQEPMVAFDPVYTVGRQITETIVRHEGSGPYRRRGAAPSTSSSGYGSRRPRAAFAPTRTSSPGGCASAR